MSFCPSSSLDEGQIVSVPPPTALALKCRASCHVAGWRLPRRTIGGLLQLCTDNWISVSHAIWLGKPAPLSLHFTCSQHHRTGSAFSQAASGIPLEKPLPKPSSRSSCCNSVEMNPTSIHKDTGLIPGPAKWVKDLILL